MSEYINDKSPYPQSYAEIAGQIVIFEGHDRPRYVHPVNGVAGYLGLSDWSEYWNKPVAGAEGTGTLTQGEFYSIKVVPVNSHILAAGFPIYGNMTAASIPAEISGATSSLNFTIPTHTQTRIRVPGVTTEAGAGIITDDAKSWSSNEWAGYIAKNVETGETDTVVSNTATTLTLAGVTIFASGARYQILDFECTSRLIYAAEMGAAAGILTATFYLAGVVSDNTTTTFELTAFSEGETFVGDMYAPPNAGWCHAVGDVLFCGGGVSHRGIGTAAYLGTTETIQAAGGSTVAVSVVDDDYTSAGISQILRYTLPSAFTNLYVGSYVTITDSEDAGNDVADVRVQRVASDNTWFEILNNDGTAQADDESMLITMTPNVIVGTSALFTEGMQDAYFNFTTDNAGQIQISWVDPVNDILGLSSLYAGNNAVATAQYEVTSKYNLYYSDYQNPHRFRAVNVYEVGDEIVGLASVGRNILVFCKGSLWRQNTSEPGSALQLITDDLYFDAPHSICSNGTIIAFYDGDGISVTDGISVSRVTAYKAKNYLDNINKNYISKIQGVYDRTETRFVFSFAMGTDALNNYGLYISDGTFDCFPFSRVDCNALFTGYLNGILSVYHGTSGELSGGNGAIWRHAGFTDGLSGTAFSSVITDITGQVATVQGTEDISWEDGDIVLFYPAGSGTYKQMMIESLVDNGGSEYELTFASEYDLTDFVAGDSVLFGMIPFDYGIKWTDFTSPQYLHRVRTMHFDISGMTGYLYVDQYLDLNETPVQSTSHAMTPTENKLVVPFKKGYGYTHGFRIRGYSSTEFKVNSFERLFEVKV